MLVDPALREEALALLPPPAFSGRRPTPVRVAAPAASRASLLDRSLLARAAAYTAWHALLGAVLVTGAVLGLGLLLLALSLLAG